jgi:DNA helicase-2/ATP-dependent DNA helicase PcrA
MEISSSEVFDGKKILEFGNWIGTPVTGKINFEEGSTFGTQPGDRALFMCNLARLRQVPLRDLYLEDTDGLPWHFVDRIARGLQQFKKHNDLVDYTDMLERFVQSSWKPDLDVVIVDEAQDLSPLQWEVVDRIATGSRRLVVAGDDDQAIYRWAGADPHHMGRLRGTRRILSQSYRVPSSVQSIARGIIGRTTGGVIKSWSPRPVAGRVDRIGKIEQADLTSKDILILARNFSYLSQVQSHLRNRGIPYSYRGTPAIPGDIVAAVGDWEKLRNGDSLDVDRARAVCSFLGSNMDAEHRRLPTLRGDIKLGQIPGLKTTAIWHEALINLPHQDKMFMLAARRNGESLVKDPRVRLSTIHGSKGGQADHVILLTDMAPRTKKEQLKHPDDEARVWYVGVTRAIERLTIVDPHSSNFFNL